MKQTAYINQRPAKRTDAIAQQPGKSVTGTVQAPGYAVAFNRFGDADDFGALNDFVSMNSGIAHSSCLSRTYINNTVEDQSLVGAIKCDLAPEAVVWTDGTDTDDVTMADGGRHARSARTKCHRDLVIQQ